MKWRPATYWVLSGAGLALIGALSLLWIRSYHRSDIVAFTTPAGDVQAVGFYDGRIVVFLSSMSVGRESGLSLRWLADEATQLENAVAAFDHVASNQLVRRGISFTSGGGDGGNASFGVSGHWSMLRFPIWLTFLLVVPPTIVAFKRAWVRQRWAAKGLCQHCGYDIRSSNDRCPECGNIIARDTGAIRQGV